MQTKYQPKKRALQELKQSILGLVMACPFDQTNPPDCQLCEIRQLDLKMRFQWVSGLTLAEAKGIWATHEECIMTKESHEFKVNGPTHLTCVTRRRHADPPTT
jgi:hypothetical protein